MSNENDFTLLQDGRECLPEWIHGVKNKKQSSIMIYGNHEITSEIMKSQSKTWYHHRNRWFQNLVHFSKSERPSQGIEQNLTSIKLSNY